MAKIYKAIEEFKCGYNRDIVSHETCRLIIDSLTKQIPKKVIELKCGIYKCPHCNHSIRIQEYCEYCGQHLTFKGE